MTFDIPFYNEYEIQTTQSSSFMYTHNYDSNSPFHSIYTRAFAPSFVCSLHSTITSSINASSNLWWQTWRWNHVDVAFLERLVICLCSMLILRVHSDFKNNIFYLHVFTAPLDPIPNKIVRVKVDPVEQNWDWLRRICICAILVLLAFCICSNCNFIQCCWIVFILVASTFSYHLMPLCWWFCNPN